MEKSEQFILQKQLVDFIISDVFYTISEDDILKLNEEGKASYKGKELPEGRIKLLKKQAEELKKSFLYEVLINELRWYSRSLLDKAQTEQDIVSSKLLFYLTDILNSKIKKLSEL